MRRRMLHRDGQAQASQCSSDRGMSNEGFVMVKVSVLRGPGLHEIAVILPRSCGRVFRACSSRPLNPSPRFSSCQNSPWVVTRSRLSGKMW